MSQKDQTSYLVLITNFSFDTNVCFFLYGLLQHLAIACHWSQRAAVLGDVIQVYSGSHGRTIVFCETKKDANELSLNASIKQVDILAPCTCNTCAHE